MRNYLIIIFFILSLVITPVYSIYAPDLEYSELEKRNLMQLSDINLNSLKALRKADKKIENYLTDQFPGRDRFVTIRTMTDIAAGKKEASGVYIGKSGYLMDKFSTYDPDDLKKNTERYEELAENLHKLKVPFQMILVPSALQVLENKRPAFASYMDQETLIRQIQKAIPETINICPILRSHQKEYIYYKTDHHWTSLGAYYAYAQWRTELGQTALPLSDWKHEVLCTDFQGTTWAKTGLPGKIYRDQIDGYYHRKDRPVDYNNGYYKTSSIYERKYLQGKDQYGVFFNSNQAVTTIAGGENKGKLLIIKDSYANTFAQFVLDDYKEVQMVDMRFFRGSITEDVRKQKFTDVLALYGCTGFATEEKR